MNVLHLASSNRWTGAAAPAFAEVEALRAAGINAHYAYVGGYRLEEKIGSLDYAHAVIGKSQDPINFASSVRAIRTLCSRLGIEVLHAHLTHDHALARISRMGNHHLQLVRTFHSRRALRRDPLTRLLIAGSTICIVNESFAGQGCAATRRTFFTPPPLDSRQFNPDGSDMRSAYGIDSDAPVVVVIGKVAPGRGFEDAMRAFARIRASVPAARLLIIGHGPHQRVLESLSSVLGLADSVIWAGYHEEDLAEHYRTGDVMLFTAAGSDEGHRAVLEAMGCGVPVASYDIPGVRALFGSLAERLISPGINPEALASRAVSLLQVRSSRSRQEAVEAAKPFQFAEAAVRLLNVYEHAAARTRLGP